MSHHSPIHRVDSEEPYRAGGTPPASSMPAGRGRTTQPGSGSSFTSEPVGSFLGGNAAPLGVSPRPAPGGSDSAADRSTRYRRHSANEPLRWKPCQSGRPSIHYENGWEDGYRGLPCDASRGERYRIGHADGVDSRAQLDAMKREKEMKALREQEEWRAPTVSLPGLSERGSAW